MTSSRRSDMPQAAADDHPPWVLLDTAARIGQCENATTATTKTSAGDDIAVSFSATDPPGLSSCFVHCPGLPAEAFACQPQVTGADGALLLVSVMFAKRRRGRGTFTDVFAYRAGDPPSLRLLPRPYPALLHYDHVGVLSRGGHHLAVVPEPRFEACGRMEYDLHVLSTKTMSWSTTVAPVAVDGDTDYDLLARHVPSKVVPVGGVGLGWVDLRRGVLLCNVADERPEVRLVQLPPLLRTNRANFGEGFDGATPPLDHIRDVTCSDDGSALRLVEIEYPDLDEDNLTAFRWTATVFTRGIGAENWGRRCTVDSAELSPADACSRDLFPEEIWDGEAKKLTLDKVISTAPTLDLLHDEDVMYMIAKMNVDDPNRFAVVAVNTRNKTLVGVAPFDAESTFCFQPTYQQCSFTRYLSKDQSVMPPASLPGPPPPPLAPVPLRRRPYSRWPGERGSIV